MSPGNYQSTLITSRAITAWLNGRTENFPLPRVNEALDWAKTVWRRHPGPDTADLSAEFDPDRLRAIVQVVDEDFLGDPRRVQTFYEAVEALAWPSDEFNEKEDVLAHLAYVISRQYRRGGEPGLSSTWEKKTIQLARQLPSVLEFLSLAEERRTDQLRDRYFMDPCVLLAACAGLYSVGNRNPAELVRQATAAHSYVLHSGPTNLQAEERHWFLTQIAVLVAFGYKQCGNFPQAEKWLDLAAARCSLLVGSESSSARIEYLRRAVDYERGHFERARKGLVELADRFNRCGMKKYTALCGYLDGIALKELGRHSEAFSRLQSVASNQSPELDDWVRGLALIYCAEIYAKEGEPQKGVDTLSRAWVLVKDSTPMAIAHFHAVRGEIFRDTGKLDSAIESYRVAVATYEAARSMALEALLRIVLAETLLASGRDREALSEVVTALRIVDTLGLVREGVVAVALLKESLSRQRPDKNALETLRRVLQSQKQGNRS